MENQVKKIEIEIPADIAFGSKVDGEWIAVQVEKLHPSWLVEMLRYGVQRKVNDHVSGQGKEKLELAKAMVLELHKGEAKPARMSGGGGSSVAPEVAMARASARKLLQIALSKLTGASKLGDIIAYGEKHPEVGEKVSKYLSQAESGLPVWNTSAIDAWIAGKPGGRDLIAEAKASLSAVDDITL